jgi:LPS sulfotransferase NodH
MAAEFDRAAPYRYDLSSPPGPRPDIVDLIGPWFDRPRGEPAEKTLIICAAPRTGSYELARMLLAAGVGIPHEYFHPRYAEIAGTRWGLSPETLRPGRIAQYIDELRRRRCAGGVFATKLQFWQYQSALRNDHGRVLFDGAVVVHLFRADAFRQLVSFVRALETGRYDFSARLTVRPSSTASLLNERRLSSIADFLAAQDAGFRLLFTLCGIRPIFVEFDRFTREPRCIVEQIATALDVPVDTEGLDRALALAGPYERPPEADRDREQTILKIMRGFAF